ncbi:MAG: tail fiber protein [Ignavibacteria bacterium]|nr:tail fiber protein [Ignavibacteria bacterium]
MPFYGSAAAAAALELGGWYLCDGRAISSIPDSVVYPSEKTDLIAVVGNNLPDLRGLFLRGIDPAGTYDPTANRAVGNVQPSEIQGHSHNYDRANNNTGSSSVTINRGAETVESGSGAVVGEDGLQLMVITRIRSVIQRLRLPPPVMLQKLAPSMRL